MAEGSAQVKGEPAKRAEDTEQNLLPSRLRACRRTVKYQTVNEPGLPALPSSPPVPAQLRGRR